MVWILLNVGDNYCISTKLREVHFPNVLKRPIYCRKNIFKYLMIALVSTSRISVAPGRADIALFQYSIISVEVKLCGRKKSWLRLQSGLWC
jgi:hypothetical protein